MAEKIDLPDWGSFSEREQNIARRAFALGVSSVTKFSVNEKNEDLELLDRALLRLVGQNLEKILNSGRFVDVIAWKYACFLWLSKERFYRNCDISRAINAKMNHSSITHAVARAKDYLDYDKFFSSKYYLLKTTIKQIQNEDSENCNL